MTKQLKVSSSSNPNSVAGALVASIREVDGPVQIQSVGAGSLNQAVKAIAIARGFVAPTGIDLRCSPSFADIQINGDNRTALVLTVEKFTR